jgi:HAD superfamily hydrolase (TIGR01490 family)
MAGWRRSRASSPEQGLADVISGELSAAAAEVGTPLEVGPDPRAAAFFDVDNTLMRGASLFLLARGLYARKFFRTGEIAKFGWQQLRFRVAGSEKPEHIEEIRQSALSFIAGHTVADLSAISEEIFDAELAGRIWPGTQRLAHSHLDEGQRVWLVTATPVEVAGIIAQKLGLTGALGTVAEHVDGVYTGRLVGDLLHGEAKAAAVRALAIREGLELERCSAYSDSANDIPMLSLVGYPCAINPDSALRAHAKAHGWRVRDFRKGRRAAKLSGAAAVGAAVGGTAAVVARRMIRTSA